MAITVVLAAVLYILISGLTSSSGSKPYTVGFGLGTPSQTGTGAAAVYFLQKPVSVSSGLTTSLFGAKISKPGGVGVSAGTAGGCAPTSAGTNSFTTCTAPATVANPAAWFLALANSNGGVVATFDATGWHYAAGTTTVSVTNAHQFVIVSGGQAASTPMSGSSNTLAVYGVGSASVSGSTVL